MGGVRTLAWTDERGENDGERLWKGGINGVTVSERHWELE